MHLHMYHRSLEKEDPYVVTVTPPGMGSYCRDVNIWTEDTQYDIPLWFVREWPPIGHGGSDRNRCLENRSEHLKIDKFHHIPQNYE